MFLKPAKLGSTEINIEELRADKKGCRRFGPCGVGKKALYLNSFYIDRRFYVAAGSVIRAFKRVAMSKGGFSGKGMFATIPYLVVVYDNGQEKQCNFKYEEQVDQMLAYIRQQFPSIKTVSAEAEKRIAAREAQRAKIKLPTLSEDAAKELAKLSKARAFLEERPMLSEELSIAAKKKRTFERTNPSYKWVALFVTLLGAGALLYGIYALITHAGFAVYFLLFGLAAIFLFSSANVLPTAKNNKRAIEKRLEDACQAMNVHLSRYPHFPVPVWYAHPVTLKRMEEAIRYGRAQDAGQALDIVKEDLKKLNADVRVEQEEYDEVVAIKPLFLIRNYE